MSFIQAVKPPIPPRLYHYTSASNAMSILTSGIGVGEEICFWLKNCKEKNDKEEISFGNRLVNEVRNYLEKEGMLSMLEQIKIKEELIYANSFTEAKVNQHMIDEYGNVRLEFDFRDYEHHRDIEKCQYFNESDILELTELCISDFKSVKGMRNPQIAIFRIEKEWDIISKIATLKSEKEWEEEAEWRHIFHKQPQDSRIFLGFNGKELMKVYYPQNTLTGITVFYDKEKTEEQIDWYKKFKSLVRINRWENKSVQLRQLKK
jgi:hypothetical protein